MEANKLVYEVLETLYDYLPRLINGILEASEDFKKQREDKGLSLLVQIIEGLQWCVEVVYKTESVLNTYGIQIEKERINELFHEIVEALENQDYVLTSDLLEYEIIPILKEWHMGLEKVYQNAN